MLKLNLVMEIFFKQFWGFFFSVSVREKTKITTNPNFIIWKEVSD